MTQSERLRELLLNVKEAISSQHDPNDIIELMREIDEELAQPVQECARCEESEHAMHLRIRAGYDKAVADSWRAKVSEVERERDIARAEVMRFKKAIHTRACQNQSAYNLECVCGADEYQRDLQKLAFRRGVEAMREAAAVLLDAEGIDGYTGPHIANIIRAIPIPEEES